MKFILISAAAIVALILVVTVFTGGNDKAINIDGTTKPDVITKEVEAGEATLLDVRTQVEYDIEHATIAENHNVEKMIIGDLPDKPKDHTLYLYCNTGNRTGTATQILEEAGFTNVVDLGAFTNWKNPGGETAQTELPYYLDILAEIGAEPLEVLGLADAKLTMVKYTDYQCPYCARYTLETEPQILDKYVKGPDAQVRYELRNVAFKGGESALAAIGGYCANEQSLHWEYHDQLSQDFSTNGPAIFTYDNLSIVMHSAGGDANTFMTCLRSDKYDSVVSSETIGATKEGVTSTPSFIIGDQGISGALPFEEFEKIIDAQL